MELAGTSGIRVELSESSHLSTEAATVTREATHSRVLYMDVLRVVASICVVIIHTSSPTFNYVPHVNSPTWWLADALIAASRWSVPMFVMISGAFILGYRERYSTRTFFLKRFTKVLIPFAVWSGIYLVWQVSIGALRIQGIGDVIHYTVSGPAMYHLWFFYLILGLYLATPILAVLVSAASRPLILFFLGLCIVNSMILPLITYVTGVGINFDIPTASAFVGYFVLGWVLKDVSPNRAIRYAIYILGVASVVFATIATHHLSARAGQLEDYYMRYDILPTFFTSIAVFIFFKSINWNGILRFALSRSVISLLAAASLGIYLIHIMGKYYFEQLTAGTIRVGSLAYLVLSVPVIYVASALIVLVLQKIPVLSALVP